MRLLIFATAVVLIAAGCGGGQVLGGGASITPSDALAFVALDTHVSDRQWQAADSLLRRFSSYDGLVMNLRPALASEVDVVVLANGQVVGLTRHASHLPGQLAVRKVGGWTAFSHSAAALAALGPGTLAHTPAFRAAFATLPGNAFVRAYASAAEAPQLLGTLPGRTQVAAVGRSRRPGSGTNIGVQEFAWGAADVVSASGGLKVEAHALAAPQPSVLFRPPYVQIPVPPYTARLPDEIPAGALFVADVTLSTGEFELTDPRSLPPPLQGLLLAQPELGNTFDTILGGETALYVRPGPEVTLVTQPADTTKAVEALASVKLTSARLFHLVLGGELVVSTSQRGIDDFRGGGEKLSADPDFRQAKLTSGMPEHTNGFVYANLEAGSAVVRALAPLAGVALPPSLRRLTAFAGQMGGLSSFVVFLR